jgi:site-specific DNA recombinase
MAESRGSARKLRCAIYTRKSSEEGLEQAFNSLHAQREACAAFILSQKHEGWTVLPTLYDDGGFFRRHHGPPCPAAASQRYYRRQG